MKLTIKGRNTEITTALNDYVLKRFEKLEKYFTDELTGTVTLIIEKDQHIAEATIPINRYILRAETTSDDMYASIDSISEKIERQVRKYKTRVNRKAKHADAKIAELLLDPQPEPESEPDTVVKTKRFPIKVMDVEEAIMQMELLDHDFFVFLNDESNEVDVVYRRHDGRYGLLQPEVQ